MTALKPIECRHVKGVSATKYRINRICAVPGCDKNVGDKGHHIFPRSQIGNSSYFVKVEDTETFTIPHVIGLCPDHHRDVEAHRAWIKLEDEQFVWYEDFGINDRRWEKLGPLNPQPGGRVKQISAEKKTRKKREKEPKRKREVISVRVPKDERENGAEVFEQLMDQCKQKLGVDMDTPMYFVLVPVMYDFLTR